MTAASVGHGGKPPIDTPTRKRESTSSYTPELAHISCNRLVEGKSLKAMRRKSQHATRSVPCCAEPHTDPSFSGNTT
jgi:hypothetical protein